MEKQLTSILVILAFIIGAVGGNVFSPEKTITEFVNVEVPGEAPDPVEIPVEVEVVKRVADPSLILDNAVATFLEELEDDDDLEDTLTCNGNDYDFDEVSVSKVYDGYTISVDDDEQEVEFKIKLKYDEDDERSCKQRYDVSVFEEIDEDVVITID